MMISQSNTARRQKYGYSRMTASDDLMAEFLISDKKQIVFWAENVRNRDSLIYVPMKYETFKVRLKNYLTRTKQFLSAKQRQRNVMSDQEVQGYAEQYLKLICWPAPWMNTAQFFEQYFIMPPYNIVLSYERFKLKLGFQLKNMGYEYNNMGPFIFGYKIQILEI